MALFQTWKRNQARAKSEVELSGKFGELAICFERGWTYEGDWLRFSKQDRANIVAFVNVREWKLERDKELSGLSDSVR